MPENPQEQLNVRHVTIDIPESVAVALESISKGKSVEDFLKAIANSAIAKASKKDEPTTPLEVARSGDTNARAEKRIFAATPGECLFEFPITLTLPVTDLPDLLKQVHGINDDRLTAIVTALVVENRVNRLLQAIMPQFKLIEGRSKDFSASMREIILDALQLIPPVVLKAAGHIRNVRNTFAHHLEYKTFNDIPDAKADSPDSKGWNSFQEFHDKEFAGTVIPIGKDKPRDAVFEHVAFYCVVNLDHYYPSLQFLNAQMRKEETVATVWKAINTLDRETWERLSKETPISIEKKAGRVTRVYGQGITVVTDE